MAVISFPTEVQTRLEMLEKIERLQEKASAGILHILKGKSILPIAIGRDVPPDQSRESVTTTALAAIRLPRTSKLKSLFEPFFVECRTQVRKKNRGLSSETFGSNNPMTASFVALAHRKYKQENTAPFDFSVEKLLSWLKNPDPSKPLHGYPASLCANVLETIPASSEPSTRRSAREALNRIANWAQGEVMEQITHFHSLHMAYFDVGELALTNLLACELETLSWRSPITTNALAIAFKCQAEDGMWYSSKPFWHASGRATLLASCQVMSALMEILRHRTDLFKQYEQKVNRYVDWLADSSSKVVRGKLSMFGWAAEASPASDRIDIWITLENVKVLGDLKTLIQRLNRHELLRRSGLVVNWKPMRWTKLVPPDLLMPRHVQLKTQLTRFFITPWKNDKSLDRCSIVLYGPPGTSKTTVAGALADAMGREKRPWPLITIGPGDFIAGGEQMAEINATNIFRVLLELENVVILFDEIDQLLLERTPNAGGGALQFMTTSMLTKFQTLKSKKRNIFVLTTNRFEDLDIAVKRAGRFDGHIAVMPPDYKARIVILSSLIEKYDEKHGTEFAESLNKVDLQEISINTALFTYPELESITLNVLETTDGSHSAATVRQNLISAAKTYPKATGFRAYVKRPNALLEISALVKAITRAEYREMQEGDRNDLGELREQLLNSPYSNSIPGWLKSERSVGKLPTTGSNIRSDRSKHPRLKSAVSQRR
jgi:MoxR-like ATPase